MNCLQVLCRFSSLTGMNICHAIHPCALPQLRHAYARSQQVLPTLFHGFSGCCTPCLPGPDAAISRQQQQHLVSWAVGLLMSVKVRFHFSLSRAGSWLAF